MPLQDHFHPPLSERRQWHAFHHAWATVLSFQLNQLLPPGYFADPNVQFGIEIDVAAFEDEKVAGSEASWQPPAPTQSISFALITDVVEVQVYNREAGPVLAGAIELVSPANKDRPAHRDAFVSKCASLLHQAIGLIVIDVVTHRQASLHAELLQRLNTDAAPVRQNSLWAASYRPAIVGSDHQLDIWHEGLAVGQPLPTLPFWLKDGPCLQLNLETAYMRTCQEQRLLGNGQLS